MNIYTIITRPRFVFRVKVNDIPDSQLLFGEMFKPLV